MKTKPVSCASPKCTNPVATKRRGYCSGWCSAYVRNRSYYLTDRGRMNKRAALARYFQNHKEAVYASRAARFSRYEQAEMGKLVAPPAFAVAKGKTWEYFQTVAFGPSPKRQSNDAVITAYEHWDHDQQSPAPLTPNGLGGGR